MSFLRHHFKRNLLSYDNQYEIPYLNILSIEKTTDIPKTLKTPSIEVICIHGRQNKVIFIFSKFQLKKPYDFFNFG